MLNTKRFSQRSSSHVQFLLALSITAALAFTLGAVTGPIGRQMVQTPAVVDQASQAARVVPATNIQPATSARSEAAAVRVPYEAGWELYDGGWAGGPAFKVPALVRVPYEMGWELYDGGWAGGPAFKMPTVVRVPYEMGWELYDGGWAGGPNTYPAGMTNQ